MVLFFPDNTVLINFATIGRIELLEALANGNGRWCLAVAAECSRSARIAGLESLADVPRFLGQPLTPSPAELTDMRILRDGMVKPGDGPQEHFGEAETVTIITSRGWRSTSVFVSDDAGALELAAAKGLKVVDSWDLLALGVRVGKITESEQDTYEKVLRANGRHRPHRSR